MSKVSGAMEATVHGFKTNRIVVIPSVKNLR
jgi:hypothetical protein